VISRAGATDGTMPSLPEETQNRGKNERETEINVERTLRQDPSE
jgi:hypothetical protein